MNRPGSATALLSAHGAGDGIVTVVRDLAVAAYALRARGLQLDVLLLDDGQERPRPWPPRRRPTSACP